MEARAAGTHPDEAPKPALPGEGEWAPAALELNTALQEARTVANFKRSPLWAATSPANLGAARKRLWVATRVLARWRALVAARKGVLLLRLLDEQPDLFREVLKLLHPFSLTMLAQVGRPWLAAVLASGLPRMPGIADGVTIRLPLAAFCTSVERMKWAKAGFVHGS
jgi:hypothetical protein